MAGMSDRPTIVHTPPAPAHGPPPVDGQPSAEQHHPGATSPPADGQATATSRRRGGIAIHVRGARGRRRLVVIALGLALLGIAVMPLDVTIARWVRGKALPGDVHRLLGICEAFAHGWGVVAILAAAFTLDKGLWIRAPSTWARPSGGGKGPILRRPSNAGLRLLAMALVGGLLANAMKLLVLRVRPRAAALDSVAGALATFDSASLGIADPGSADLLSFPSGHAASAAGLAAALATRYPRGTRLFAVFAALAALQRVSSSAHYPSDVCCGAAVGCIGAALAWRWIAETRQPSC